MSAADLTSLAATIEAAFDNRDNVNTSTRGEIRDAVETALNLLDGGKARVAERGADGSWTVNQWLKKAVLLSFRLNDMGIVEGGPGGSTWWDKVPSKFEGWDENRFREAGFRAVPSAVVRRSAFIAPNAILMPSFVNLGAYVGEGTMVDTWATVGSCAQIGKHVHLSGGVGIGGVLEPMQAGPTIIEDNCFIGARSEVVEGCIVREGSVLGMGVFIGKSTKIVDRATGEITYGEVPPYSVVVAGSLPSDKTMPNGLAGAKPLLRGHRQACRRADTLEDRHQRIAARLISAERAARCSLGRSSPHPARPARRGGEIFLRPGRTLPSLCHFPSEHYVDDHKSRRQSSDPHPLPFRHPGGRRRSFRAGKDAGSPRLQGRPGNRPRSRHAGHRKPLCPARHRKART